MTFKVPLKESISQGAVPSEVHSTDTPLPSKVSTRLGSYRPKHIQPSPLLVSCLSMVIFPVPLNVSVLLNPFVSSQSCSSVIVDPSGAFSTASSSVAYSTPSTFATAPAANAVTGSMAQIMTTVRISEMIFCFIFFILSLLLLLPGYSHLFYLRNPPGGGSRPGTFKDGSCRRADFSYYFNYFSQALSAVRRFHNHTAHAIRRIPPPAKPAVPGPPVSTPSTGSAQTKPNSPSLPV